MAPFKLGINMAGAVSAGAYTAGVLDFLTEALEAWQTAKANGDLVPAHDVIIEVFSGASAGGMCAAISSVLLQQQFDHIHDVQATGTTNRLYESWVNKIDIQPLLQTKDLSRPNPQVISLLDSTIIDEIADYALTPAGTPAVARSWVSPQLTLFLSLTNLRGVPYSLNGSAPGSVEESTFFYGDRIRFETVPTVTTPPSNQFAHPVCIAVPGAPGGWTLLQQAAKATGAFPVFLAPRAIMRNKRDYCPPGWESVTSAVTGTPPPIEPNFPPDLPDPYETLNVDGGITNNDPFNYAHDYLMSLAPVQSGPTTAEKTDRAVLSIAPFPTTQKYSATYNSAQQSGVFVALKNLFGALISQSRFFGESLEQLVNGTTFSRFVIVPSDDLITTQYAANPQDQPPALQCASLGAFGGFFERGYRAHDYALGRRNCQKFLRDHFVLPADNILIKDGLLKDPQQLIALFGRPPLGNYAGGAGPSTPPAGNSWIPVIPLCSAAVRTEVPPPPRAKITPDKIDLIVNLIGKRVEAVISLWRAQIPRWLLRMFLWPGEWIIPFLAKKPLSDYLKKQLT
jgi:hypothetical protein